jgi:hypothetical protein
MYKNDNLDDWLGYWKQKIAFAWRMGQHEEEEWLRLEVERRLRPPENPHTERSGHDAPNHTAEEG